MVFNVTILFFTLALGFCFYKLCFIFFTSFLGFNFFGIGLGFYFAWVAMVMVVRMIVRQSLFAVGASSRFIILGFFFD
ncbi:hypothetical protein ES332_D10G299200v1 [Gossypium tomentosum]|uniref:Uncharacterized protein n=1 Tax=Gossypium tomentosum TaxID=34277 RepID=A0A5D2J9Y0_GOSTO|nr:hypothetical protein ES332_D10G299200v1 [Gossypium tomentosum]